MHILEHHTPGRFVPSFRNLLNDGAADPLPEETYREYLVRHDLLGHGFSYSELVPRFNRRKLPPPRRYWPNMVLTLAAANEFRRRCREAGAADGLRIAAAFRPFGGARGSRHKTNRALDLDRIGGNGRRYFETAVSFWVEYATVLGLGLGLYTGGPRQLGGIRVHLDTGTNARSWQGIGRGFGKPYTIQGKRYGLPVYLAHRMGIDVPTHEYL